jgi:hypothetical protein
LKPLYSKLIFSKLTCRDYISNWSNIVRHSSIVITSHISQREKSSTGIVMEAAAALVSFVGLAGHVAQGLKLLYDFMTNMKDCPKDIREMKTDLELVEDLITEVIRQCSDRDVRLRESTALARAIGHAQESVEDLKKELDAYPMAGKRKRFRFAAKLSQTQKLRASLDKTKTIMCEFKNQLQW